MAAELFFCAISILLSAVLAHKLKLCDAGYSHVSCFDARRFSQRSIILQTLRALWLESENHWAIKNLYSLTTLASVYRSNNNNHWFKAWNFHWSWFDNAEPFFPTRTVHDNDKLLGIVDKNYFLNYVFDSHLQKLSNTGPII